jgi:hypothetical protein
VPAEEALIGPGRCRSLLPKGKAERSREVGAKESEFATRMAGGELARRRRRPSETALSLSGVASLPTSHGSNASPIGVRDRRPGDDAVCPPPLSSGAGSAGKRIASYPQPHNPLQHLGGCGPLRRASRQRPPFGVDPFPRGPDALPPGVGKLSLRARSVTRLQPRGQVAVQPEGEACQGVASLSLGGVPEQLRPVDHPPENGSVISRASIAGTPPEHALREQARLHP